MNKLLSTLILAAVLSVPTKPAFAAMEPFLGEIIWVGYDFCPRGWAEANGQLLAISQNEALFSLYGTMYGGDARTTFGLPDLRGRMPISSGQGHGLTQHRLGDKGGREEVALLSSEMPSHVHSLAPATATLHASKLAGETPSAEAVMLADGQRAAVYAPAPVSGEDEVVMAPRSVTLSGNSGFAGGGLAHENMPPYQVLLACVAITGIYPSRH